MKLYEFAPTRSIRARWALQELDDPVRVRPPIKLLEGDGQTPEYLAINPTGKVPALVDGDFVLTESRRHRGLPGREASAEGHAADRPEAAYAAQSLDVVRRHRARAAVVANRAEFVPLSGGATSAHGHRDREGGVSGRMAAVLEKHMRAASTWSATE